MLEQQPLGRVLIHLFQPAKRAPVARMLQNDRQLSQFFEGSLRCKQFKFDFRLLSRAHDGGARIGHDWLPRVQRYLHRDGV
ncbi:MAG: hypothetical protein JWQ17_322 [Tardiphaga sp.]|nr:hypothetical protein [Tardiphaga sp.]